MNLKCWFGEHNYDATIDLGKPTAIEMEKLTSSVHMYISSLHAICSVCGKKKNVEFSENINYVNLPEILLRK